MSDTVRGLVLLASVLLWLPFLPSVLGGAMTLEQGLLRYAVALLLAWAGGSGLNGLVKGYTAQTAARDAEAADLRRRSEDRAEPS